MKLFKEIKSFIMIVWAFINEMIYLKKRALQMSMAIKKADVMQKAYNKRFFVLASGGGLVVLCNRDIQNLKRPIKSKSVRGGKIVVDKRYVISKDTTMMDIVQKSFYYTPLSRNNDGSISPKERAIKRKEWDNYCKVLTPKSILDRNKKALAFRNSL